MQHSDNRLKQIGRFGQSIWCDNVERRMIREKTFQRMIREDGLKGVTSNPTIFEKAVAGSADYDAELAQCGEAGLKTEEIYWRLVTKDIREVADIFEPVWREEKGRDGFVSIEVSPLLAHDTAGTVAQARELWDSIRRPNIMVKIPATLAGLPAITQTIASGINVNVTLIFSVARYRDVMSAYLAGLEQRASRGEPLSQIASVASFFVSRVDTECDRRIEERIHAAKDSSERKALEGLLGKAAIANSKAAYGEFEKIFSSPRFEALRAKDAQVQRPLWASTSTKNARYRDVLYVEELIGPQTVNTLPPATFEAFRDHGEPAGRLLEGREEARRRLADLRALGIDLDDVTQFLETNGVRLFSESHQKLVDRIRQKEIEIASRPR